MIRLVHLPCKPTPSPLLSCKSDSFPSRPSTAIFSTLDDLDPDYFAVSAICHPSTYLNKILLGSKQGLLQLWNVRSRKLVYEFAGWGARVTCLTQSTAVDVVAAGLEDGRIVIHNLRRDVSLMTFVQDAGSVAALSFRTDGVAHLASAGSNGVVSVWNLDDRRLETTIRGAHDGAVTSVVYLVSQPTLLTTGTDNSMKVWIFDQTGGEARVLRERAGHSAPPTHIRFFGEEGQTLLSAGQDRALRSFNIMSDARCHELSQGAISRKARGLGVRAEQLKLPPALGFAAEPSRARDWDSVVTHHLGECDVQTWNSESKKLGKHVLKPPVDGAGEASCVSLSSCGNFAFVGYNGGTAARFNVQSGKRRGIFGAPAHARAVRGIAVDPLNRTVVTASLDKSIKFWDFATQNHLATLSLPASATQVTLHRELLIVAVACEDFSVRLVDIENRRIVRIFSGHDDRITDMAWSPDARWLVTGSMDTTIRTWDVPTGRQLSKFSVEQPATSVAFAPAGDFLATTHVGSVGIYLWANRSMYAAVGFTPRGNTVDDGDDDDNGGNESVVALPNSAVKEGDADDAARHPELEPELFVVSAEAENAAAAAEDLTVSKRPLGVGLVTMSSLPKSKWIGLSRLQETKERNKPKEPPKAPMHAPFFLPTAAGLEPTFVLPEKEDGSATTSKILNFGKVDGFIPPFQRKLLDADENNDPEPFLQSLKVMSQSEIDLEVRSLSEVDGGMQLLAFLRFIRRMLKNKSDFELAQAYLGLFISVHGETVAAGRQYAEVLREVLVELKLGWTHIEGLLQHSLCAVVNLKGGLSKGM